MYSLPLMSRSMEGDRSFSSASSSTQNEDNEYVWDGFTHGEQLVTTPNSEDDYGDDYYEDLELAARLGKTLLQKNKELDTQNYQLRCLNEEQSMEIEHLNKQLAWLRDINESKSRMFEQLDMNYQELELGNQKMRTELKEWKERASKCASVCDSQEEQIQSLKTEIETVRKMHEGRRAKEKMRRRTIHGCLPTMQQEEIDLQKFLQISNDFNESVEVKVQEKNANEEEMNALHEVIGNLKAQQVMDKRMIKEMRVELETIVQDNQDICEKLREEREMTQRLNKIIEEYDKVIYRQAFVAESTPNITAEFTNNEIEFTDESEDDHDDEDDEEEEECQHDEITTASKLENKSSTQCIPTKTPLTRYLRICNSTPMKTPSPTNSPRNPRGLKLKNTTKSEPKNVSLVQELDTQYKSLLGKYEMLLHSIESERVSSPAQEPHPQSSANETSSFLTETTFESEISDEPYLPRGAETAPEYKRLFREIFHIINQARNSTTT